MKTLKLAGIGLVALAIFGLTAFAQQGQTPEKKADHMRHDVVMQDCAKACSAAAQIVARGGPFAGLICESCAKACGQCATACEAFPNDEHMKSCVAECRKCEKACKTMLEHIANKPAGE